MRLELDVQERAKYGRLLAYVYVGDMMVNEELVAQGYAQIMTIPPNVRHQELFLKRQREARLLQIGLWRVTVTPPPERGWGTRAAGGCYCCLQLNSWWQCDPEGIGNVMPTDV